MQVMNKETNNCTKSNGEGVFYALEQPAMATVWFKIQTYFFFQLNAAAPDNKTGKLQRFLGFGNPVIFGFLQGKSVHIYIDGTFRIARHPLYQCLIIMAYNKHEGVMYPSCIPISWWQENTRRFIGTYCIGSLSILIGNYTPFWWLATLRRPFTMMLEINSRIRFWAGVSFI